MSYKGLPENLVGQIKSPDARGYATASGWKRLAGVNGKAAIYAHPSSDLDQLIIPLDSGASDYGRRMAEVVANLAEKEGRSAAEILNDLLLPPADVLRFRLVEPESEAGSLPLEQGIDLLQGAKRALLSAACSVIQPQTFHPRLSRTEAEQLVAASRLGQTERGSFTITVACPLDAVGPPRPAAALPLFPALSAPEVTPVETSSAPSAPLFTRAVTSLLMRSVARIAAAIDADDLVPLTTAGGVDPPLSANLCDALLLMHPTGERSRLSLSATWSRALPRPDPKGHPSEVHLRRDYFPAIESLAKTLRPAREPKPSYLVGLVDALFGDPDEDGKVSGDVQLMIFNQEEAIRARATLDSHDYHQAWEAHGVGGYVSLSGILVLGSRVHRIEQVRNFRVLNEISVP